jgi:L-alanine-DL-glutamate epimerase-like enolase superfamily enzyme
VEYIPQLDDITTSRLRVEGGYAFPPETPGLGIAWDWDAITARQTLQLEIQAS